MTKTNYIKSKLELYNNMKIIKNLKSKHYLCNYAFMARVGLLYLTLRLPVIYLVASVKSPVGNVMFGCLSRKNGKVTLYQKDVDIHYTIDFKITGFNVIGVKFWVSEKKSRPYYYKYDFLAIVGILLLIGLLCLTPRFQVTCLIARPKSPVRIFVRHLWRSGTRKIEEPLAQNVNRSKSVRATDKFGEKSKFSTGVITIEQRRNASTVGYFDRDSTHGIGTSSPNGKSQHHTIVDDAVRNNPNASHSRNCLTTKPNCHAVDPRVTEVGRLAKKLMNGQSGTQMISWQDFQPHVKHSDMAQFTAVRPTTTEEHENFQAGLHGKTENPIYLDETVNLKNRFNPGTIDKKEPVEDVNKKKPDPSDNPKKEIKEKQKNDQEA